MVFNVGKYTVRPTDPLGICMFDGFSCIIIPLVCGRAFYCYTDFPRKGLGKAKVDAKTLTVLKGGLSLFNKCWLPPISSCAPLPFLTWYCWWKKSCTTWIVEKPVNNGIVSISTGAGFLPLTVPLDDPEISIDFWCRNPQTKFGSQVITSKGNWKSHKNSPLNPMMWKWVRFKKPHAIPVYWSLFGDPQNGSLPNAPE